MRKLYNSKRMLAILIAFSMVLGLFTANIQNVSAEDAAESVSETDQTTPNETAGEQESVTPESSETTAIAPESSEPTTADPKPDSQTEEPATVQPAIAPRAMLSVTIGNLEYDLNTSTNEATVTGHVLGTSAAGTLTIPATVTHGGTVFQVTEIGYEAFRSCDLLTGTLTIPSSVTVIGAYAFYECDGFTGNLVIPGNVTLIDTYAFYKCTGFTGNLVIPNNVTKIGTSAFYGCNGFNGTLTLSSVLETIGTRAFYNCGGFTGTLNIPASVKKIDSYAFAFCDGMTMGTRPKVAGVTGTLPQVNRNILAAPDLSSYDSVIDASQDPALLFQSVKWLNADLSEAEMRIDYGQVANVDMDIVFVLDYSSSMTSKASTSYSGVDYEYPRTWIMEDIMKDSIDMILAGNSQNYDNRIAMTGFGVGTTWSSSGFTTSKATLETELNTQSMQVTGSTAYASGIQGAIDLIQARTDTSRVPVIIFLSDGSPTDSGGATQAQFCRDNGINLFPISIYSSNHSHLEAISYDSATCYDGNDTTSFSQAMSDVISASVMTLSNIQVEDKLSQNFTFAAGNVADINITQGGGTASITGDSINWDLTGSVANKVHTMTVRIKLKDGLNNQNGYFNTNEELKVNSNGILVTQSPKLSRYQAQYEYVSQTAGKSLPNEVNATLPYRTSWHQDGQRIGVPTPTKTEVAVTDGVWKFSSWDKNNVTITGADVNLTGSWAFTAKAPTATRTSTSGKAVNTGDSNNMSIYLLLAVLAAALAAFAVYKKRKDNSVLTGK